MDSWQDPTAPALARVDLAVEQVFLDCEKVRGMSVDADLVEYFVLNAVTDWILDGEDRELFRSQVVLCWNARQAELRKRMGGA
jgi:hypothetical protein